MIFVICLMVKRKKKIEENNTRHAGYFNMFNEFE